MLNKKLLYISIGVLSILAILLYFIANPEGQFYFPKCPIYQHLGVYCSGCGSQRAIHDLLHLNILDAIGHNLLLVPTIMLMVVEFCMRYFYPKKKSILYYRKAPFVVLAVIVIFMILRNIKSYPFDYLAP